MYSHSLNVILGELKVDGVFGKGVKERAWKIYYKTRRDMKLERPKNLKRKERIQWDFYGAKAEK